MDDITALSGRLAAALERIGGAVDGLATAEPPATGAEGDGLQAQLAEERTANAQLVERVRALKERQDKMVQDLEDRVAAQADQMAQLDAELQKLRTSNAEMRALNAQLRAAASDGAADAELINRAMAAEIDALETQRHADASEVDVILKSLKPLLEGESHAAG